MPLSGNWITEDISDGMDCNDADPEIPRFFIPDEICNGMDDDCDGLADEETVPAGITANVFNLCGRPSIKLTATSYPAGYTYLWYKNNALISGAYAQTYKAKKTGDYTVKITSPAGCSGLSDAVTIYRSCREEELVAQESILSVYPNPATDYFTVDLISSNENGEAVIEIYDLTGKLVISKITQIFDHQLTEEFSVDDKLSSSVYIIRIISGEEIIEQRLLINK